MSKARKTKTSVGNPFDRIGIDIETTQGNKHQMALIPDIKAKFVSFVDMERQKYCYLVEELSFLNETVGSLCKVMGKSHALASQHIFPRQMDYQNDFMRNYC